MGKGPCFFDRVGIRLAVGRLKRMETLWTFIRRWAPLLSVLILATTTVLQAAGHAGAADLISFVAKTAELSVTDLEVTAAVTAGAGAVYKLTKIVVARLQQIRSA